MSATDIGAIGWVDLTVADADPLRDFYSAVGSWTPEPVQMGGHSDYAMRPSNDADAAPVAGICHARGPNTGLPPCWLVYINVKCLDEALAEVCRRGGSAVGEIRGAAGHGRFCVIRDPSGAYAALAEPAHA